MRSDPAKLVHHVTWMDILKDVAIFVGLLAAAFLVSGWCRGLIIAILLGFCAMTAFCWSFFIEDMRRKDSVVVFHNSFFEKR